MGPSHRCRKSAGCLRSCCRSSAGAPLPRSPGMNISSDARRWPGPATGVAGSESIATAITGVVVPVGDRCSPSWKAGDRAQPCRGPRRIRAVVGRIVGLSRGGSNHAHPVKWPLATRCASNAATNEGVVDGDRAPRTEPGAGADATRAAGAQVRSECPPRRPSAGRCCPPCGRGGHRSRGCSRAVRGGDGTRTGPQPTSPWTSRQ